MPDLALHVVDLSPGVALVPGTVEVLGCSSELHDEVAGQVLQLDLAPFFAPQADQGGLVAPMMRRASEPPMKLRLLMESANLKACVLIQPSHPGISHVETSFVSTIFIDRDIREHCQQKLLIIR